MVVFLLKTKKKNERKNAGKFKKKCYFCVVKKLLRITHNMENMSIKNILVADYKADFIAMIETMLRKDEHDVILMTNEFIKMNKYNFKI